MSRSVSMTDVHAGQSAPAAATSPYDDHIQWYRVIPFIAMHIACLGVFLVEFSWIPIMVALALFIVRMFAITAFYHRYFSHRTFKTSRLFQFLMAFIGCSAAQRGPLWWAAQHRHHHNHSDEHPDEHSPGLRGFWMSHMGWFMTKSGFETKTRLVRDWLRFRELALVERFDYIAPVLLATGLFVGGGLINAFAPTLGVTAWNMLIWGFFVSTIVLYHGTYTINSLAHRYGSQRFSTGDDSRNNFWLALVTLGEGWHNNHHHYPASARQGFYWWEIDLTYYVLRGLAAVGLIWDLRPVPARVLAEGRRAEHGTS